MKIASRTLYNPFSGLSLVQYLRVRVYCPQTWFLGYECTKDSFVVCLIPGIAIQFYWF